jgi:DNA (cytosine-5)-methyltransferase 1
MEIRVFTAFSGYDSQCMALDRLHQHNPDFTYELVGWAEIDKYAIQAHNAVYPQWAERNYGDISKIDWAQVPDFDLFTYSSPCQDFSQAGKQAGGTEGSGTRSSLLWECRRAILAKRPKYLLMENVAALVSQKFIRLFNAWQLELESYGYRNFAKVLNAKDYGVPQNRERIFMVSVLDETARYEFPDPMPLTIRLKDVLEKEVEERYYLSDSLIETFNKHAERQGGIGKGFAWNPTNGDCVGHCLEAKSQPRPKDNWIIIPEATKDGYIPMEFGGVCDLSYPNSDTRRGRVQEGGTVAPTLTCGVENSLRRIEYGYRIRKLTERECFRLMDMPEEYIDRIQAAGISRSQQYKMAGNSIVVACMYHIWRKLFIDTEIKTLTLF